MELPIPKELLGTKSDYQLAKDYRISQATVRRLRISYGIPTYSKFNGLPKEAIDSLGKIPDPTLAKTYNTSEYFIKKVRKALDIGPAKRLKSRKITLPEEGIALLGTMSDQKVANKLSVSKGVITRKRHELGIPPFAEHTRWNPTINWTSELDSLLGTMPDTELAKQLNIKKHVVYKRRTKLKIPGYKVEYDLKLLFSCSVKELTELWGVDRTTVYKRRYRYKRR